MNPLGTFSSIPIESPPSVLVPLEPAAPPDIGVRGEDGEGEQDHLDQPEPAERVERDRPGVEEDDLDVEDDEQHRGQVVLDREAAAADRLRSGLDAALVAVV